MVATVYLVFAGATGLAAVLAAIAVGTPRATWLRAFSIGVVAVSLPLAYLSINELLARPKPMHHEWINSDAKEAMVLGVSLHEGKAIFLWLRIDDAIEPRYYRLPWHQRNAEKLQKEVEKAAEEELGVRMENPFSRHSWTSQGEINIELIRPPQPPLKQPAPPPRIFNPRDRQIPV